MKTLAAKIDDHDRSRAKAVRYIESAGLPPGPSLAFLRQWVGTIPNVGTADAYGRASVAWLGWCAGELVDPFLAREVDAQRYLASLTPYAPATRAVRCAVGRSFYEEAIDKGLCAGNPFRKVRPRNSAPIEPTPALTLPEWERVLDLITEDARGGPGSVLAWRDFTIVYLGGRVGLRCVELVRLTWADVRTRDGDCLLRVHGKGDKWASVAAPGDLRDILEAWRAVCERTLGRPVRGKEAVFPMIGRRDGPGLDAGSSVVRLTTRSMTRLIAGRALDAGLDGPRFAAHCLRATAATLAYQFGADVLRIQIMLRHASISTTLLYIKRAEEGRGSAAGAWMPRSRSDLGKRPPAAIAAPALANL